MKPMESSAQIWGIPHVTHRTRLDLEELSGLCFEVLQNILPTLLLVSILAYTILYYFDYSSLSPFELFWNTLVYVTPCRLLNIIDHDMQSDSSLGSAAWTHAAKSETMRRLLGLGLPGGMVNTVAQAGRTRLSSLPGIGDSSQVSSGRPPGLGNWDNSCYQNSILQGLASLETLPKHLKQARLKSYNNATQPVMNMASSLEELIEKLKGSANNGKRIWTPATLKSMSSWQQQDAQEYFSKVMDEMEKEMSHEFIANKADLDSAAPVLELKRAEIAPCRPRQDQITSKSRGMSDLRNPLEGLLAQRVGCTRCGYSEGLSMIPFNCLTLPLGRSWHYDLSDCLDEYTKLEPIEGVECGRCTLLKSQRLLRIIRDRSNDIAEQTTSQALAQERLAAVTEALEEDDYDEKTLAQKCKILPKNRVCSTKSRQAVIARPPASLAVHLNRSLFDEMTGNLTKNHAEVGFPRILDLGPWTLGSSGDSKEDQQEEWKLDPDKSMIAGSQDTARVTGPIYELRAVITHYGRHENGHYICYRKHPTTAIENGKKVQSQQWWRLSDDDVTSVTESAVQSQGGVFMLFYDLVQPAVLKGTELPSVTTSIASTMAKDILVETTQLLIDDGHTSRGEVSSSPTSDGQIAASNHSGDRTRSMVSDTTENDDLSNDPVYEPRPVVIPRFFRSSGEQQSKSEEFKVNGSMIMA